MRLHLVVLFSITLAAPAALGQNIVANPNFGVATDLWSADNGIMLAHDNTLGRDATGSALITSAGGTAPQISQCVAINSGTSHAFGVSIRPTNNSGALIMTIVWFDGNNCTGNNLGSSGQALQLSPTLNTWHDLSNTDTPEPGTLSARIEIVQNTGTAGVIFNVDDVFLGANDTPVELQSFSIEEED